MDMSQMSFPPGYQFPVPGAGPSFDPTYGPQFNTQQYNAMFSSNPPQEAYGTFGNMASQSTTFQASNPAGYGGYSTEFGPGFNNPGTGYSTYQYSQEGVNAPVAFTAPPPTQDPGSTAPAQSAAPVPDYNSYGFQQSNYDQNLGTYSQGSSDLAQGAGAYTQGSSGFDQGTSSYEQSGAPQYTYEQANQPYTGLNTQPGKQSMDWAGNNQYYNYNLSQNEESSIVGTDSFQTGNLGPVNTNTYSSTDQYTSSPAFDQSSAFTGPTAAYTTGDGSGQQSFTKPMGNSAPQTQKGFGNMPAEMPASQQSGSARHQGGPVSQPSGPAAPNSQGGNFEAFSHFNQNAAVSANSDFSGGGRGRGARGGYQGGYSGQGGSSQYYGGQDVSAPPAFGVGGFSDQQGDGSLFPGPNSFSNNDGYSGQFGQFGDFSERNSQSSGMAGRGGRGGSVGNGGSRGAGMAYRGARDSGMSYPQDHQTDGFTNQPGSVQSGNFSDMTGRGLGFSDLGSGVGGLSRSGSRGPPNRQDPEKSAGRGGLLGQYGASSDYPKRGLLDDAFPDVSNDQHMGHDQFSNFDNHWEFSGPGSRGGGSSDRGSWGGNFGNRGGMTGVSNRRGGFSERSLAGVDSDMGWRSGGALHKGGLSGGFLDSGSRGGLSDRGGRSGGVYDRLGQSGGTGVSDKGGRGGISRSFGDRDVQDGGYSSRGGFSGGNIDKTGSGRGSTFADRGGRGGGFSDRGGRGGGFSDRSGPSGGFSDRGGRGGDISERGRGSGFGYFDKTSSAGEFSERDDRDSGFFDRSGRGGGFSERGGRGGGFSDRGGRGVGFSDRGGSGGGFSDRGGRGGGFSDRGGRGGGFSDRGGRGGGFSDRGDREIGFADSEFFDRGGRGSGSSDRGGGGFSDRGRGGTFSDRGGRGGGSSDRGGRGGEFSDRGGYNGGNFGRGGQSSASKASERGGRSGEFFGRGASIAAKSTPVPLSSLGKQGILLKPAVVQAQDAKNTTVNPKGVNTAQSKAQTNVSLGNKATVAPAATNISLANKNKATVTAPATNVSLANKKAAVAPAEITKKDVTKAPSRPQDRLLNEIQEKEKAKQAAMVKRSPEELKKEEEKRLEEEKRKTEVAKKKAEEEKKKLEEERKKAEIELRNKIADEAVKAAPPVKPPETPEEVAREQEIQRKIRESVVIVNPIQEQVLLKDDPSKEIEMSEELRKLLKTLSTEVLCKLCSVRVAGPQMASMHYNGKNHIKKVRNFVQTNGRSAGFNMETAGKEKEDSLKEESNTDKPAEVKAEAQVVEITDVDENKYCKVCKVSFAQDCQAQMHYKGKNHAKKIKSIESGPELYECKVCCVTVTAQEHLTAHLNGARHKAQVRKMDTAESFRGAPRGRGRGGGGRGRGAGDVPSDMNRDIHAWTPLPDARPFGPGGNRGRGAFGSSTRGAFGSSPRGAFDSSPRGAFDSFPRGQGFGGLVPLMFEGLKRRGAFDDGPSFRGMMQPPFAKRPRF